MPFSANFNGNNFSISNLFIDRFDDDLESTGDDIGLFGAVSPEAGQSQSISNIRLDGALMSVRGHRLTGGLIGYINNTNAGTLTLSNNSVSGDVLAGAYAIGGLIGYIDNRNDDSTLTLSNNRAYGDVSSEDGRIGGLAGDILSSGTLTLSNNIATGDVSASFNVAGGLISQILSTGDGSTLTLSNNIATGDVSGAGFSIGGLVAWAGVAADSTLSISNNMALGDVSGATDSTGGLIGSTSNEGTLTISANLVSSGGSGGSGTSETEVGAFIGSTQYGSVLPNYSANYYNSSEAGIDALLTVGQVVPQSDDFPDVVVDITLPQPEDDEVAGFTLSELQCPLSADNSDCIASTTLYEGWDSSVWDFGTTDELPGLIIDGLIYRDADGDGNLMISLPE